MISGLGTAGAGVPDTFQWWADRPIALVIIRSGADGDDVSEPEPETETVATTPPASSATSVASILARMLRSGSPA